MQLPIIVAIIIGFLTISIRLYIAYRQGAFKKTRLFITAGIFSRDKNALGKEVSKKLKNLVEKNRSIWAVIVGIPDRGADYFIIQIPYLIENTGDTPLRNILVQFQYRNDFDCSSLSYVAPTIDYGIKRGVKIFGNELCVEYSIPILTPSTPLYFVDFMAVKKNIVDNNGKRMERKLLNADSNSGLVLDEVKCICYSENIKPVISKYWILIALSENITELIKKTEKALIKLHQKNCPPLFKPGVVWFPRPRSFWYSLLFPKCILKKTLVTFQCNAVGILKDKEKTKVLIQDIEKTEAQFGEINWNIRHTFLS